MKKMINYSLIRRITAFCIFFMFIFGEKSLIDEPVSEEWIDSELLTDNNENNEVLAEDSAFFENLEEISLSEETVSEQDVSIITVEFGKKYEGDLTADNKIVRYFIPVTESGRIFLHDTQFDGNILPRMNFASRSKPFQDSCRDQKKMKAFSCMLTPQILMGTILL